MERSRKVVNDLLTDVFNQILILEERNLTEHDAVDVTMTEIHVIEAIRKCEPATMGTVSKRLMITMGTLTTSVNRLVEKGYVTRKRDVNDRRVVLLDLTEKGQKVFEIHEEFHDRRQDSDAAGPQRDFRRTGVDNSVFRLGRSASHHRFDRRCRRRFHRLLSL